MDEEELNSFINVLEGSTDYLTEYGHSLKVNTCDKNELKVLVKLITHNLERFTDIIEDSYGL